MNITRDVQVDNGLVVHDPEKTWMDSYQRGKSALEVQSIWARVLKNYNPALGMKLPEHSKKSILSIVHHLIFLFYTM